MFRFRFAYYACSSRWAVTCLNVPNRDRTFNQPEQIPHRWLFSHRGEPHRVPSYRGRVPREESAWRHFRKRRGRRKRRSSDDPSWVPGRSLHDMTRMWSASSQSTSGRRHPAASPDSLESLDRLCASPDDIRRRREAGDTRQEKTIVKNERTDTGVGRFGLCLTVC